MTWSTGRPRLGEIATLCRRLRHEQGLTLAECAERSGLALAVWEGIEDGTGICGSDTYQAVARVLMPDDPERLAGLLDGLTGRQVA